jgi:predicted phage terminase large subunit-like protein
MQGFPSIKQAIFLALPCDEIFFGGAARGGKSIALLAGALQFIDRPGYAALILRRTYQDLAKPGALMDVAHQWLANTGAHWNGEQHEWSFPSGAKLCFGHLESENDKYKYQSAEYQYIAPDETTHYTESQYVFLFSRLSRATGSDIPLRMRTASNPGGNGHYWVKNRFVADAMPYCLRFIADDQNIVRSRCFMPARLEDNPGIDHAEYEKQLAALDAVTRAQLRRGDWDIMAAGNMFKRQWFRIVEVAPADVVGRCRAWDLAATQDGGDWLVGTRMSRTSEGVYTIEHVVRGQWGPYEVENIVKETTKSDGRYVMVRGEQEPAASGKIVAANWIKILAGYDVKFDPSSGEKTTRWRPFSAQAEAGNVWLLSGSWDLEGWLDRVEKSPQIGVPDDELDSATSAFNNLAVGFFRVGGDIGIS